MIWGSALGFGTKTNVILLQTLVFNMAEKKIRTGMVCHIYL